MADLSGQTLGKYQLIERMGRGGMADVYKGYQPGLDRYVAVKVLHPHLSEDPDFITRFKREAKSVSELRHPYIIQVFDFDIQGENYYMVMEYVEGGQTLKQLLQDRAARGERLPLEQALDIVSKLADALAYAHGLGMVHRDIKPANVLIPSLDRPVLSDFGIARIIGQTGLTGTGTMVGTPAYMSPEQGKGERGDARSDIYALGIVLYEMLTGRPPYDADTPLAVILKHINDPLVPPRNLVGSLPDPVERIVLKCLAKNPDDRYASMADLRDTLRAAVSALKSQETVDVSAAPTLAHKPPSEAPVAPMPSTPVQPRQRPLWLLAAGGVAAVGIIAVLIALNSGQRQATPTQPAVEATAVAAPTRATEPPTDNPEVAALVEEGRELLLAGDANGALEAFEQAVALDPDSADARVGRAISKVSLYYEDATESAADLEYGAQVNPDDPLLHYGLGLLRSRYDGYYDADAALENFTTAIERCGDLAALCTAAYVERSQLYAWTFGDVAAALADLTSAIELNADTDFVHYFYASRADIHDQAAGDAESAMKDLETAYELSLLGEYLERAATMAVEVEDHESAFDFYEQLLQDQAGDPHYLVGRGYVEWRSGDPDSAVASAQRALALEPDLLEAHYLLGLLLLDLGQPQEALNEFQVFASETDPDRLYVASLPFFFTEFGHEIHFDMARAARALSDPDSALAFIEQSLQSDDYWPYPYIERGMILAERGDLAGARENYLKALETAYDDPELQASIEELLAGLTE